MPNATKLVQRSCATCKHSTLADSETSVCRRMPPTVVMIPGAVRGTVQTLAVFPPVNVGMWCGEWTNRVVIEQAIIDESSSVLTVCPGCKQLRVSTVGCLNPECGEYSGGKE